MSPAVAPEAPPAPAPTKPRITGDPKEYYMPDRLCPSQRQDAADGGRPR